MVDLQTLGGTNSEALDMNDAGHIVGVADTATGGQRAFVYRNGAMTDLNTLLPSGSGWVLQRANAISAGGQIVGVGTFNGADPRVPPDAAGGRLRCGREGSAARRTATCRAESRSAGPSGW